MRDTGRTLANVALLFALAVWGGTVFFFTFVNTPVIFAGLDRDAAARLLGELFARYYRVQLVCVLTALAVVGGRLARGGAPRRLSAVAAGLLAVALAITLYSSLILLPRMAEAQGRVPSFVTTPRDDPARVAYGRLHGRAMVLNAVAATLGGVTLALIAFEPALLGRRGEREGIAAPAGARSRGAPAPVRRMS